MSGGGRSLPFRLLAIGDRAQATAVTVEALARGGGGPVALLLRDRSLDAAAAGAWVEELLPTCRAAGCPLLVHFHLGVATESGADGLHLPAAHPDLRVARARLGDEALLGVSCHGAAEIEEAGAAGADYVTLSPVFATPGKGAPLGLAEFARITRSAAVPVVALGGITPETARECRAAGAAGVAAIRAVWDGDPAANVHRLLHC